MLPNQMNANDLVIVERRQSVRIIVNVPGSYALADHRNPRGERRIFACRAVNVSQDAVALAAPVSGKLGERVIANIEHLGRVKGSITRLLTGGFVMSISASDEERDRLAAKIDWLEQFKNFDISDQRAESRFVPKNPNSRIVFADGTVESCFVLDLSASGAAIAAETLPKVGTVLALATIVGRVVRHFDGGFAVQFIRRQDAQNVEASVALESIPEDAA
jgi:hypothetical protein